MATISNHQMGNGGLNPEGRSYVKHDNIHYSQGLRLQPWEWKEHGAEVEE